MSGSGVYSMNYTFTIIDIISILSNEHCSLSRNDIRGLALEYPTHNPFGSNFNAVSTGTV